MESLSRPFHRRKLSNANSFSGKSAYDGVFSGHRPKFDGIPVVKLEEYREIFSSAQADSSIPFLEVSALEESSDDFNLELGNIKPDYSKIFGGFRDEDIAVSYQELLARDKARAPSSTSPSSQDSVDAMKQFNLSYNKISQRNKDGLDGTTHVTQLHAVPGYTCFIDEATAASRPNKETENQKSSIISNVHHSVKQKIIEKDSSRRDVESSSIYHQVELLSDNRISGILPANLKSPAASVANYEGSSQPNKEVENQKSSIIHSVNSSNLKIIEKDELLSDDKYSGTLASNLKSHPSKVSSAAASVTSNEAASQPKKETENQKSSKRDFLEKETSQSGVESTSRYCQEESLSDDRVSKTLLSNEVPSPPGASVTNKEAASQPNKETENKKSSNVHTTVNSSKQNFPEKQTSQSGVQSRSIYHQHELLSDDRISKTFQAEPKSHASKVSSLHAASVANDEATSQPNKESEKQRSFVTNNVHTSVNSSKQDFPEKQTSQGDVEFRGQYRQDESLSDDRISNAFQADIKLHSSKVSSSATNVDNNKDFQEKSAATNTEKCNKGDTPGEFPPCFSEELDVNSAAAASAAALRKAIEKAQESIRIAKESVGRKKEGLRSFSSKSFKDSLIVKGRVANVSSNEEQKEKLNKLKETLEKKGSSSQMHSNTRVLFPNFGDGEKLFGAKKVINDIHGKFSEPAKKSEIPPPPSPEPRENKTISASKEVIDETEDVVGLGSSGKYEFATRSSEVVENSTHEAPKNDDQRSNVFLVSESYTKNLGDIEDTIKDDKPIESKENDNDAKPINAHKLAEGSNDLTVYEKVEDEKKKTEVSDPNVHDKSFNEALGLLENNKQEFLEQEHDEKVAPYSNEEANLKVFEDEKEQKESTDTESCGEEDTGEKFYDVSELEMIENAQPSVYCLETNEEVSLKDDYEMKETCENLDNFQEPENFKNSSSDYDAAEGRKSVHACEDGQSDNNADSSQEVDVSSSSSAEVIGKFYEFQIEEAEAEAIEAEYMSEEKERFENLSADQTASEDNDDLSESSSHMTHGMEIEVKEYKEREGSMEEEEELLQQNHEGRPETPTEMKTGTSQEYVVPNEKKHETKESRRSKVVEIEHQKRIEAANAEERERERNRLAVERVIREARERAFAEARERAERAAVERATAEVRQRVMADAQEKAVKASIGTKTSAQSRIKAERAAVERATAEARQRALEKAMSQKIILEPKVQVNEIQQSSSELHISNGTSSESAQRIKAKLEKQNRIMERAAKALAEKEKRDLLAQKEQAERSRLAENLDADIKRWSSGKQGNLRALLSTLQYILGAESGWQPVSLTEIITTSAVKKAYRKATLCVHPDKLQQRGASIQQKYICEKVFDLLKAAWNRFNSEER